MTTTRSKGTGEKPPKNNPLVHEGMDSDTFRTPEDAEELVELVKQRKKELDKE